MTQTSDIPYFPATAPEVFTDPAATTALLSPVLAALAEIVDVDESLLDRPTPCASYTVGQLRDHVLGWLQFFAAALGDPDRTGPRPAADDYRAADDPRRASAVVTAAADDLAAALAAGSLGRLVVMSASRMDGSAVAAMALGEYLVHGWDLAVATGAGWSPSPEACRQARTFFATMVAPEYRSADGAGGFFGPEIPVPDGAPELDQLLGFAGRDPRWAPPA